MNLRFFQKLPNFTSVNILFKNNQHKNIFFLNMNNYLLNPTRKKFLPVFFHGTTI